MSKLFKNSTAQLFIALFFGIAFGTLMKALPAWIYIDDIIVNGLFKLVGNGFIELIKMTVVPLIFTSLVCGISSFSDTKKLGKVGAKTLFIFLITTLTAILISLILTYFIKPGEGINATVVKSYCDCANNVQPTSPKSPVDIILDIIPSNPIKSMSKGNLLQILVFASFFGVSLGMIGEKSQKVIEFFNITNDAIMKIVSIIMKLAPIGVFALISNTVYSTGFESLIGILKLILTVVISLAIQAFVVYGTIYKLGTKLSFIDFLKNYSEVAGISFSTSSSNAAIPFSMKMMEKMNVDKSIYQFVLPIGATVNMAGTAIMQCASAMFIAQAYNIPLSLNAILTITLTAVFASVGAAGVPGVGMIMMTMILGSVGLPVEGIALIMGFDRILDMVRTVVNVMGDCVCAVIVDKLEKAKK